MTNAYREREFYRISAPDSGRFKPTLVDAAREYAERILPATVTRMCLGTTGHASRTQRLGAPDDVDIAGPSGLPTGQMDSTERIATRAIERGGYSLQLFAAQRTR